MPIWTLLPNSSLCNCVIRKCSHPIPSSLFTQVFCGKLQPRKVQKLFLEKEHRPHRNRKKKPTFSKSVLGFKCIPERAAKKATLTNGNDTLGAPSLNAFAQSTQSHLHCQVIFQRPHREILKGGGWRGRKERMGAVPEGTAVV